jgi:NAD(P)-dependent dehydrogenase (short-subunit alcohol dehydrogenase family)
LVGHTHQCGLPGFIDTPLTQALGGKAGRKSSSPSAASDTEEVAEAVIWLVDAASISRAIC